MDSLTEKQQKVVKHCTKKARIFSKNVEAHVFKRFLEMDYGMEELDKVRDYIKNKVNIIIHFNGTLVEKFISDGHYKSCFEVTGKGVGYNSWRSTKEKNIFGGFYDDTTEPSERLKYGCINLFNSPTGWTAAQAYGRSFLVLKQEVKLRTTYLYGNSSGNETYIQNFDSCNNMLLFIPQNMLKDLIEYVINGKIPTQSHTYVECQIHGDIDFNRDIEDIVQHDGYGADFTEFRRKFLCHNKIKS